MNVFSYMRQTDHSCFTGNVWIIHNLWYTYRMFMFHGLHTGPTFPMEDSQNTKNQQSTDNKCLSEIGINFPTPSPTT